MIQSKNNNWKKNVSIVNGVQKTQIQPPTSKQIPNNNPSIQCKKTHCQTLKRKNLLCGTKFRKLKFDPNIPEKTWSYTEHSSSDMNSIEKKNTHQQNCIRFSKTQLRKLT